MQIFQKYILTEKRDTKLNNGHMSSNRPQNSQHSKAKLINYKMIKTLITGLVAAATLTQAVNVESEAEWDRAAFASMFLKDGADLDRLEEAVAEKPRRNPARKFLYKWYRRRDQPSRN